MDVWRVKVNFDSLPPLTVVIVRMLFYCSYCASLLSGLLIIFRFLSILAQCNHTCTPALFAPGTTTPTTHPRIQDIYNSWTVTR